MPRHGVSGLVRCQEKLPWPSAMTSLSKMPRPSACLYMVTRPSAFLDTTRPRSMTCLGKVPEPRACPDKVTRPSTCLDPMARPSAMTCLGKVPRVTDLVSQLSSHAALRQLAPRMFLSQPPTRLASYAWLQPPAWKQRELKTTLGERTLY